MTDLSPNFGAHDEAEELLPWYATGQLDPAERVLVEKHLSACADCRDQLIEEVLDDTMMVVWQTAANFRGSSKPSTWIFAIAYRKAYKAKLRWPDPVEDPENDTRVSTEPAPDEEVHHRRLHDSLVQAMDRLSPDHRAVVDLTYFHGMGYREIAEIVDCPVDTVKTRMFHARRRLKQAMPGSLADWL